VKIVPASVAVEDPLWWALRDEYRLAGMACPVAGFPFGRLSELHAIDAVVSLLGYVSYDCSPLRFEQFRLQDLYGGVAPEDPEAEWAELAAAASTVRELLDDGTGVVVHCAGGTGRTGTVIGAVLVSLGGAVADVAAWLDEVHRARGRAGWPESPWQRDALTSIS